MAFSFSLTDVVATAATVWFIQKLLRKQALPFPPGPPGKVFVGNTLDIPKTAMAQVHQYAEWAKNYGPLIHLNAMGTHIIIINDFNIVDELLNKRSGIYSDRPYMTMASELCGWDRPVLMRHYGDNLFKEIRRGFQQLFGTRQSLEAHSSIMEEEAHILMKCIMANPNKYTTYVHKCAASIALRICYGYPTTQEGEDPVVDIANKSMRQADDIFITPYIVDVIPWLKYIPEWLPGTSFKQVGRLYRQTLDEACDIPYRLTLQKIREGTSKPCFVQRMVDEGDYTPEKEMLTKWTANSLYNGGVDTTLSAVGSFFLAMTMFPAIFRKAQMEMDAIVGRDRLPTLADRPDLPYIDAIQHEILRWAPVLPLGVPHSVSEDDIYNGHLIPKGAIIVANVWYMLNDPDVYKNPREFNPDRFIGTSSRAAEANSHDVAFGFGRRVCPGQNLADATTFLQIALAVATLDISRALDESGKEIIPEGKYDDGILVRASPFPCIIKARDAQAEALVHDVTS